MNAFRFMKAIYQSREWLRFERPDAVVSVGGFAAAPTGLTASWFNIPLVLLEQNTIPGRVTKMLTPRAQQIHLQFEEARGRLPKTSASIRHSGSPVREEICALADGPPVHGDQVLFMGGSQGAQRLNELVCKAARHLVERGVPILHVAGRRDIEMVRAAYKSLSPERAEVIEYADDMAALYRRARVALMRAGASTAAELTIAGLPAILVPYPASRDDHQTVNARALVDAGAAALQIEASLDAKALGTLLVEFYNDDQRLAEMRKQMRSLARPDAGAVIAADILRLASPQMDSDAP